MDLALLLSIIAILISVLAASPLLMDFSFYFLLRPKIQIGFEGKKEEMDSLNKFADTTMLKGRILLSIRSEEKYPLRVDKIEYEHLEGFKDLGFEKEKYPDIFEDKISPPEDQGLLLPGGLLRFGISFQLNEGVVHRIKAKVHLTIDPADAPKPFSLFAFPPFLRTRKLRPFGKDLVIDRR